MKFVLTVLSAITFCSLAYANPRPSNDEQENDLPPGPTIPTSITTLSCYQCQTRVNPKTGTAADPNCLNPSSDTMITCKVPSKDNQPFCGEFGRYNEAGQLITIHRGCSTAFKQNLIDQGMYQEGTNKCFPQTKKNANGNSTTINSCLSTCNKNYCNGSTEPGQSSGLSGGAIAGIVIGSVVGVLLLAGIGYYIYSSTARKQGASYDPTPTAEPRGDSGM